MKIIFMGTSDFAQTVLEFLHQKYPVSLVVSQPDNKTGRKQVLMPTATKKWAIENKIPVWQPVDISTDYQKIIDLKPDMIITCAYGQKLPVEVLNTPILGAINVHGSLLPKYRGGAPIHYALIKGEKETGITIMYMAEKMDAGDIIAQDKLIITDEDNVATLHEKLAILGGELLIEILPKIITGNNDRFKQDEILVTYAPTIKRADERIDFNKRGVEIYNLVRGLNSWPLANALLDHEEMKIIKVSYEEKIIKDKQNGEIIACGKDYIDVKVADGIIRILEIKPFGKKQMLVKDYLNGVNKASLIGKVFNNG